MIVHVFGVLVILAGTASCENLIDSISTAQQSLGTSFQSLPTANISWAGAAVCTVQSGYWDGSGLPLPKHSSSTVSSADACCATCTADPQCKGWSWDSHITHANCDIFPDLGKFRIIPTVPGVEYVGYASHRPSSAWPSFANANALAASPWGDYFKEVYGVLPAAGYPIRPEDLWMLYTATVIKSKVVNIPAISGDCPTANPPKGQRYNVNNQYAPRFTSWIWHPYPYPALAANSWAEVLHQADPYGDEHFGAWLIYAPGSGIYFNLGVTKAFPEHSDAYKYFGVTAGDLNEEMSKAAVAKGLDSVQFLAHVDHVNYQCDTKNTGRAGLAYMGMEIVGVKLVGTYACTTSRGAPASIKAGWKASKACACVSTQQFLNCQGVPASVSDKIQTRSEKLLV